MNIYRNRAISEYGFTLIEALIAMFILTVGILSLYSMQLTSITGNSRASKITIGSNWAMDKIEELIEMDYDDLSDSYNDGEAGLDDLSGADDQETSSDEQYTLYWNVAEDYPIEGCKTLRVRVQDNNNILSNAITYQYIKEELN
jgi:type IV pilus modification protein PilV